MITVDNKVALRQLQLANAELLKREASRTPEDGKSIALDGKFHPRVLTLVGTWPLLESSGDLLLMESSREVTIQSRYHSSVACMRYTGL